MTRIIKIRTNDITTPGNKIRHVAICDLCNDRSKYYKGSDGARKWIKANHNHQTLEG